MCYLGQYPRDYGHTFLVVTSYTCTGGYTLSGTTCSQTFSQSASIASYSCPAGRNLVGTGCVLPGSSFVGYACPNGGTLSGNTCTETRPLQTPPGTSNAADRTLAYIYGPEHQRIREVVTLSGNGTSAYFAGSTWFLNGEDGLGLSYEKEARSNGTTEYRHYLTASGQAFALFTSRTGTLNGLPATTTSYFHHDQLGSISAISNEAGAVTERLAYDPWGKRRFITSTPGKTDALDAIVGQKTDRGYTEHEHLDEMGVIHMNGRIFDPLMGRFMSADPFIQAPYNLKSFNRYSYVWNNPLKMWDPTGYNAYHDSYSGAGYGSTNTENSSDTSGVGGVSDGHGGQMGGNSGNRTEDVVRSYSAPPVVVGPPTEVANATIGVPLTIVTLTWVAAAEQQQKAALAKALADTYNALRNGVEKVQNTLSEALGVNPGAKKPEEPSEADNVPANIGPGPNAGDSVPAGPSATPTKEQQDKINGIGNVDGCHTCGKPDPGTKSGNWVGDHQPPTALNPDGNPQSYYPQCLGCSRVQGGRIRGFISGWTPKPD
ncbi:MAG: hypothetical protein A3F78_04265 [Burkholderiales bacterium RIFCSPLOWO2_12_FULL_61_40]|nr:MAG: hypothetical protein A3F78_04265 [Burkholderiales bacterium RIFCSPLOWO2_12_FULL_61_40]